MYANVTASQMCDHSSLLGRIARTAKDASYFYGLGVVCLRFCVSVCLCLSVLVTTVSPAKTAEVIEMQFGMWICEAKGTTH